MWLRWDTERVLNSLVKVCLPRLLTIAQLEVPMYSPEVYIYQTPPPAAVCDTRSFLKWGKAIVNSGLSFSSTSYPSKAYVLA